MNEDLNRLEEKIAYLERHVLEQDKVMLDLAEQVGKLRREIGRLRHADSSAAPFGPGDSAVEEPPPPHY